VLPGTLLEVRVEGCPSGTSENFPLSSKAFAGPLPCTTSGLLATGLSVDNNSHNNQVRVAEIGTATQSYICVQAVDSVRNNDTSPDTLTLDRLFLFPTPVAVADVTAGQIGAPSQGSYISTGISDNTREVISEDQVVGGFAPYRLVHTWKFTNVPGGASHTLHYEGFCTGTTLDKFQFSWAPDVGGSPGTFTNFSTQTAISTSTEIAADSNTFTTTATTIYIRVTDTQKSGTANSQNTLNIDHLALKTTP